MKKRTTVNYETVKQSFDDANTSDDDSSYFRVNGGPTPVRVAVPTSIMHRLFRLGQAYNIRQFRFFESNVKLVIGTYDLPSFIEDLKRLKELLNDEGLHHYANLLISEIEREPGPASKHVALSVGEF